MLSFFHSLLDEERSSSQKQSRHVHFHPALTRPCTNTLTPWRSSQPPHPVAASSVWETCKWETLTLGIPPCPLPHSPTFAFCVHSVCTEDSLGGHGICLISVRCPLLPCTAAFYKCLLPPSSCPPFSLSLHCATLAHEVWCQQNGVVLIQIESRTVLWQLPTPPWQSCFTLAPYL